MIILNLEFELRKNFDELKDLFQILNNMVSTEEINSVDIEVKDYIENNKTCYYLYIGIHRCKLSFASIEIRRDLANAPSKELSTNLLRYSELKRSNTSNTPVFEIDDNKVTIKVFDTYAADMMSVTNLSFDEIMSPHEPRLLSLEFYLRKPFIELPEFIAIANKMYQKNASSFITLKPSIDNKKTYLNINWFYEDLYRPSLCLTVGLLGNSVPSQYQFELAKFNFACSKVPNLVSVFINCNDANDSNHGPVIRINVFESTVPKVQKEIEKQFRLLDSISPI